MPIEADLAFGLIPLVSAGADIVVDAAGQPRDRLGKPDRVEAGWRAVTGR
jgi:hypothetical protein